MPFAEAHCAYWTMRSTQRLCPGMIYFMHFSPHNSPIPSTPCIIPNGSYIVTREGYTYIYPMDQLTYVCPSIIFSPCKSSSFTRRNCLQVWYKEWIQFGSSVSSALSKVRWSHIYFMRRGGTRSNLDARSLFLFASCIDFLRCLEVKCIDLCLIFMNLHTSTRSVVTSSDPTSSSVYQLAEKLFVCMYVRGVFM